MNLFAAHDGVFVLHQPSGIIICSKFPLAVLTRDRLIKLESETGFKKDDCGSSATVEEMTSQVAVTIWTPSFHVMLFNFSPHSNALRP